MKFRNVLSLFLCLAMMLTIGQSIAISSSAKEYSAPQISNCVKVENSNQITLSSAQKTAFSWKNFSIAAIITAVLVAIVAIVAAAANCGSDVPAEIIEQKDDTNVQPEAVVPEQKDDTTSQPEVVVSEQKDDTNAQPEAVVPEQEINVGDLDKVQIDGKVVDHTSDQTPNMGPIPRS